MTKIVIYSDIGLDGFYEQTKEYLHDKYHTYSTSIVSRPITPAQAARTSYYDAMGRGNGRRASRGRRGGQSADFNSSGDYVGDVPIGKRVF